MNLRAAIHWGVRDDAAAAAALRELPHRSESALDAVSLHNSAIVHMESDQAGGFRKLNHLLASPPFPRETFGNLLLLYLRYDCLDLAADTMAENAALTYRLLTPDAYDFLDASILAQTNAEDALLRFAALGARHAGAVRAAQQAAAAARSGGGAATAAAAAAAECVTAAVEAYTPVLMAHARIHWDRGHYAAAEHQLRAAAELAGDTDTWRINLAHACFMQETKHREAIRYYEPYVRAHWDAILDVTAIVLANLCVAYIMTSRNEEAEGVMRRIEATEAAAMEAPEAGPPPFHLCIVNLVVGTLYCSKGNFEFGLSRVMGASGRGRERATRGGASCARGVLELASLPTHPPSPQALCARSPASWGPTRGTTPSAASWRRPWPSASAWQCCQTRRCESCSSFSTRRTCTGAPSSLCPRVASQGGLRTRMQTSPRRSSPPRRAS